MKTIAFILTMLLPAVVSAQQKPTTGYAPVNGLKMYYEVHGSGDPVLLLHGSFMTISNNWTGWIGELSKRRKVIACEMQGHGRTADIKRDFSYENLADDVAALLDYLKIPSADLIGYSMGGGVAMQCAIRHPEKVRKVVSISAVFRHDGWVKEALDIFPQLTPEALKGSPISEMFRLKGDEIFGDMRPRSASRLAILPNTTHLTLMERMPVIVPTVNDFLDAKPQKQ
jgi:pimeloyl-ACP methyl ester carboxylesterase